MQHNFSGALSTWKGINLSELQKTLDNQGIELVENQKESLVGRKGLADRTKEFKKISDEEKLGAIKGLLKAYQTEIDALTKRSKFAENAFLSIYKVLAEAPDPYPLLEAAVDQSLQLSESQSQLTQLDALRSENAELKRKLKDLENVDGSRKKAEKRAEALETKMDESIQERVAQKEAELNATYDEKMRNYEERERDLQRQLSLSKAQLRELRSSVESSQAKLLDQSQRQDYDTISKLAETDMLASDLERAHSRIAQLERRNELLRADLEASRAAPTNPIASIEDSQIDQLESELSALTGLLENAKREAEEARREAGRAREDSARRTGDLEAELGSLKRRLDAMKDYDEVRRELDIMKYVEFGGMDDEGGDGEGLIGNGLALPSPNPRADRFEKGNRDDKANSLEVLLATKNKRIQDELTKFRLDYTELEASLRKTGTKLEATLGELEKQKELNERLENDLLALEKQRGSLDNRQGVDGDGRVSDEGARSNSGLAGLDLGSRKNGVAESSARTAPIPFSGTSADTSILPIVTSQRDRFRQRNAELEEELRKQYQIISELRTEIKSLQTDNLKLYEKVRYMQSYREEASRRHATSTLDPLPSSGVNNDDMNMSKYRARYEQAMNPFEQFRGREAARAYSNLNPLERGVLVLTKSILGNRRARNAFIGYAVALHLLVMFTTYECATSSGTQLQTQPHPY